MEGLGNKKGTINIFLGEGYWGCSRKGAARKRTFHRNGGCSSGFPFELHKNTQCRGGGRTSLNRKWTPGINLRSGRSCCFVVVVVAAAIMCSEKGSFYASHTHEHKENVRKRPHNILLQSAVAAGEKWRHSGLISRDLSRHSSYNIRAAFGGTTHKNMCILPTKRECFLIATTSASFCAPGLVEVVEAPLFFIPTTRQCQTGLLIQVNIAAAAVPVGGTAEGGRRRRRKPHLTFL